MRPRHVWGTGFYELDAPQTDSRDCPAGGSGRRVHRGELLAHAGGQGRGGDHRGVTEGRARPDEPFSIEPAADTLRRRLLTKQGLPVSGPASFGSDKLPNEALAGEEDPGDRAELSTTTSSSRSATTRRCADAGGRAPGGRAQQPRLPVAQGGHLPRGARARARALRVPQPVSGRSRRTTDRPRRAQTVGGFTHSGDVSLTRQFKTGATLTANLAIDLVKLLTGDRGSLGLLADATVTMPLMRGSGRRIVTEPLTQAERDVVYAIFTFERFKRTLAVRVASDYLSVLQQLDQVRNAEDNYADLIPSSRRAVGSPTPAACRSSRWTRRCRTSCRRGTAGSRRSSPYAAPAGLVPGHARAARGRRAWSWTGGAERPGRRRRRSGWRGTSTAQDLEAGGRRRRSRAERGRAGDARAADARGRRPLEMEPERGRPDRPGRTGLTCKRRRDGWSTRSGAWWWPPTRCAPDSPDVRRGRRRGPQPRLGRPAQRAAASGQGGLRRRAAARPAAPADAAGHRLSRTPTSRWSARCATRRTSRTR